MGSEGPGLSAADDSLLGLTVSHYRVLEVLGRGGMGVVYRGRDERLSREVALKFLHPGRASDPSAIQRFRREARTASALNHPSICTLLDIGQHEGQEFLVMELLEGTSVAETVRRGRQEVATVVRFGAQVSDALAAAHQQGIVHRDIKPANLFITTRGEAKILDFGVARVSDQASPAWDSAVTDSQTASGSLIGTLAYMSPEQARGEKLDGRSDIFALGAVLYELLTGRPAFSGQTPAVVFDALLNHDPIPPGRLAPRIPDDLEQIVMQALEKRRERRHQSAADLAAALVACQTSTPRSPPTAVTVADAPARFGGRRRLAVAGVVVAVAAAGLLLNQRLGNEPPVLPDPVVAVAPLRTDGAPALELAPGVEDILVATLSPVVRVQAPSDLEIPEDRNEPESAEASARGLGADYLLKGDLARDGARVRLTLDLQDLDASSVVWSDTAEGEGDVFLRAQAAALRSLTGFLRSARDSLDGEEHTRVGPAALGTFAEYSQARAFLERPDAPENVDRAIALLEGVAEKDPDFALGHAALGEAFWRKSTLSGDPSWLLPAQRAVDEAVRLDAEQPLVRYTRAEILRATGRSEDAIEELHAVLLQQPDDDGALRLLGRMLTDAGRTTDAIARLQRAVALRPSSWANHQDLGVAHYYAGDYAKAAAAFRRVTELQPDFAWGYQMLGTVHHAMGEAEPAIAFYRQALELSPDPFAYFNMGNLLYSEERYGAALAAFEQAVALEPREPSNHRSLGDTYLKMGRADDARRSWAEAVRLGRERLRVNPEDADEMANLAVCEAKLGHFPSAERHAARAVETAPTHSAVLFHAAVALALAGQPERAVETLQEAVEQGYSPELIQQDEDLEGLRGLSGYQAVVNQ